MPSTKQSSFIQHMRNRINKDKKHKYVAAAQMESPGAPILYCSLVSYTPIFETKSPLTPANIQENK